MSLLVKKLFCVFFIYINLFTGLAIAQTTDSESSTKPVLSDVQSILENEQFVLQDIYFNNFEDYVRNCVFESPSAKWTIQNCHIGKGIGEGYWSWEMAGDFSIKGTNTSLPYSIRRGYQNVYRDIAQNPSLFIEKPSVYISMSVQRDEMKVNVTFNEEMLPFLQVMARMEAQLIEQSIATNIAESEAILPNIESIMDSEQFVLQRAFRRKSRFSDSFDKTARSCVFESPSAIWTIHYCQLPWDWKVVGGNFSIKDTNISLSYYVPHYSDIYTSQDFAEFTGYQSMFIERGEAIKVGMDWFSTRVPFIRNMVRIHEQLIEQSVKGNSEETL